MLALDITIIMLVVSLTGLAARTSELTLGFPIAENPECFLPRKGTPDDGLLSPEDIACPSHDDGLHECCRCMWTLHFRHMWFRRDYEYSAYLQKLQTIVSKKKKKLQYGVPRKYIPTKPPAIDPETFIAPMVPWQIVTSRLGASAWTIVDFRCRVTLDIDDWIPWFSATSHYFKRDPVRLPFITRNYRIYCRPDEYFQESLPIYEQSDTTGNMDHTSNTFSGRCEPKDPSKARGANKKNFRRPYKDSRDRDGLQRFRRSVQLQSHASQCIEISRDPDTWQGHMYKTQEMVVTNQINIIAQQTAHTAQDTDVAITLWPELHIQTGDLFAIDRNVDSSQFNLDHITDEQPPATMSTKLVLTRKWQDGPPMSQSLYQGGPSDVFQVTIPGIVRPSPYDSATTQWQAIPAIADAHVQACIIPGPLQTGQLQNLEFQTSVRFERTSNEHEVL